MSNYHLNLIIPPSIAARDAKEQRRKQLEEVRERRKIIYHLFKAKMQQHTQQASDDVL